MKNRANIIGGSLLFLAVAIIIFAKKGDDPVKVDALKSPTTVATSFDHSESPKSVLRESEASKSAAVEIASESSLSNKPSSYYWEMKPRPYDIAYRSDSFEWTAVDGKSPDVMRQLATNPSNLNQLEDENEWVKKRQLIYLPEGRLVKAENIFNGVDESFMLPGFDGKEFEVEVGAVTVYEDEDVEEFEGTFHFWSKDNPNIEGDASLVGDVWSIGYKDKEATVYQQIISRRNGELILTQFDIELENRALLDSEGITNMKALPLDDVGIESDDAMESSQ